MQIGFLGLGKLGLPCALAMSAKLQEDILGFDINPKIKEYIDQKKVPYFEQNIDYYLNVGKVKFQNSLEDVVLNSDIVFLAIQTPHEEQFEGITPVPDETKDFDYSYLIEANKQIKEILDRNPEKYIAVVVISTMLPGTMRDQIIPIYSDIRDRVRLIYNPYFIAMGTTIPDFLNPEFVLIGKEENVYIDDLTGIYWKIVQAPVHVVNIESAELAKVAYNTFIGMKIIFANAIAEITRKNGGNSEEVMNVLFSANKRIISSAYMKPGLGDGGGCHPRDQIAMSHLAKKLDLSSNIFDFVAKTRDSQTLEIAKCIKSKQEERKYQVVVLGEAYKPNINLTVGSPSKLLQHYLKELNVDFTVVDPIVNVDEELIFDEPKIFFIATPHEIFKTLAIPIHSVVIDIWGSNNNPTIPRQYGIQLQFLGKLPKE